MRIRFIEPSPRAGEVTHIDNITGRTLIASGFAELVPYKDYRERLSQEGQVGSDGTNVNPNVVSGVEWGVLQPEITTNPVCIIRRFANETVYFDGVPDPVKWGVCPPSIVAQFHALTDEPTPSGFSKEQSVVAELQQKERDAKGVAAVLYKGR